MQMFYFKYIKMEESFLIKSLWDFQIQNKKPTLVM